MFDRNLKIFISFIYYIFWKPLVLAHRMMTGQSTGTFVILTYHSVYEEEKENFRKQMEFVKKTAHAVFPDGRRCEKGVGRHVAVTFDDGYFNVIENAVPILQELGIPATIFVTTGKLGQKPDWIIGKNNKDRDEKIATAQELLELDENMFILGSHTVNHGNLSEMDEPSLQFELARSKQDLEALLGGNVSLLAFPFGAYNEKVLAMARQEGYKNVFGNIPDARSQKLDPEGNGLFLRGRVPVSPLDDTLEFRLKCSGAYQWLPIAIDMKKRVKSIIHMRRPVSGDPGKIRS
jgi:peptidoglycan/xylan/chitin deacetylase (PgdA/CDA1 family)